MISPLKAAEEVECVACLQKDIGGKEEARFYVLLCYPFSTLR